MTFAPSPAPDLRPSRVALSLAFLACLLASSAASHAVKRRAFATSTSWTGDIVNWPGATGANVLEKADSVCRALAAAADPPLPNAATYRAWLSTSTTDAYCHVQGLTGKRSGACGGTPLPGAGPWFLFNGATPFTGTLAGLVNDGIVYRGVLRDENGEPIPEAHAERRYWTGTNFNGVVTALNCEDWSSGAAAELALVGDALGGAIDWTNSNQLSCDDPLRLLCLEPGPSEAAPPAWSPGSIVFLTSETGSGDFSTWPSAGGFAGDEAAHEICETRARGWHLPSPESFVPWISTTGVDAIDRVTSGGPFRRIDGVTVAASHAGLASGALGTGIYVHENGEYQQAGPTQTVWTGTLADGTVGDLNCDDWSDATLGSHGLTGDPAFGPTADWTAAISISCAASRALYCISNRVTLFWDGFEITADTSRWSGTTAP